MCRYKILIFILILFYGCNNSAGRIEASGIQPDRANGFSIDNPEDLPGWTRLTVYNPWEKAKDVSIEYYLSEKEAEVPVQLTGKTIIHTPVQRVICLSTTHLAFLDVLEESDKVVGISGNRYISNPEIRNRMDQGLVPDVGYGQNLNYELIVNLKPDVVMVYGIGSEVTSYSRKLEELGIPVVLIGEYLEKTPLGKAEWLKFISVLFEKEDVADKYFNDIENEYNRLKQLAFDMEKKPKILVGSPYRDSWWVPGGNSYLANLIHDAGGDYLGKDNISHESYVISFENALSWGSVADVWINMSNLSSKSEMLTVDERFNNFSVFNNGIIYNNIRRLSSHGGNDFWESGTINPHLILRDLISIFHPGLIADDMVYYQEVK